jgi:Leucine-rich repeat (LRR) protein
MDNIPADILRVIALNLPIRDILNLCQTNKRYQQHICNNKPFWEALLLRETKGNVNIPSNTDINWYREKLKIWPSVKVLVEKIKANNLSVDYIQSFNDNWDDFEIIYNLTKLHCYNRQLTLLPPMSNLRKLDCGGNHLTSLPPMANLKYLICSNNQLTSLPSMPNLQRLYCNCNQLISLPPTPNLIELYCNYNQLSSLPPRNRLRGVRGGYLR